MKDDILLEIDRKREREELLLPARRFAGENRKYLTLGVFKKSPKRVKSVPCPNGCGVSVKVLRQTERGYLVMCDHGEKESEDIYLPPEEVELYALDWVTFNALVENGTIDYYRPSTPEERWRDKKAARMFLREIAQRMKDKLDLKPSLIVRYIFSDEEMKRDNPFQKECKELRELADYHDWGQSTVHTYVKQAVSGHAPSKTISRNAKRKAKARKRRKELESLS